MYLHLLLALFMSANMRAYQKIADYGNTGDPKKAGPYFESVSVLHFLSEWNETSVITNLVC